MKKIHKLDSLKEKDATKTLAYLKAENEIHKTMDNINQKLQTLQNINLEMQFLTNLNILDFEINTRELQSLLASRSHNPFIICRVLGDSEITHK